MNCTYWLNPSELEWFIGSKTQIEIFNNQIKSVEKLLEVEVDGVSTLFRT